MGNGNAHDKSFRKALKKTRKTGSRPEIRALIAISEKQPKKRGASAVRGFGPSKFAIRQRKQKNPTDPKRIPKGRGPRRDREEWRNAQ